MLRNRRSTLLGLLGLAALPAVALAACASAPPPNAVAFGALAEVQVLDRDTNALLPIYWHKGQRYIAGEPGHRYALVVRNRSGGRVLALVSVDGISAVTGQTAAWDQSGYVFSPGQRWEVRGWRKSQDRIAAFEFTRLADSYAARTGRPDHVGVIGVALFREAPRPLPSSPPLSQRREEGGVANHAADANANAARAQAPAAPSAEAAAPSREARRDAQRLGTGHGASEWSQVGSTQFERAQARPDEVITIRYDSRQNLMALGVIARPSRQVPQPDPFPGQLGFVPEPPPR
ncbi:MAG: hypothetical protein ACK54C_01415 [Betaproteobacteria bacterium]|jgi:hypothetical protein